MASINRPLSVKKPKNLTKDLNEESSRFFIFDIVTEGCADVTIEPLGITMANRIGFNLIGSALKMLYIILMTSLPNLI